VVPFVLVIVIVHLWGSRVNRKKARSWMVAHQPILSQEFAHQGFDRKTAGGQEEVQSELVKPEDLLKEKSAAEYMAYATGRQNVAFLDVKLTFIKRYNPLLMVGEAALGFFFDSMPAPEERMEATLYAFDGKETALLGEVDKSAYSKSTYDGFVFAVVHKDLMKRLRDERYDLSLTSTKDNAKLPDWATTMSEGNEITEAILTPDLVKAIATAGETFEALVVTDMPMDKPKK
jgi:hypothetical protein